MPTPDPQLVEMFRAVRSDARNDPKPTETAQTFNIEFTFDGAGQLPVLGDVLIFPVGALNARLLGAQMVADVAAAATITLSLSTITGWPTLVPLAPVAPAINVSAAVAFDVSSWTQTLQPNDILSAKLTAVTAPLTSVTLALFYRRLKWSSVTPGVIDLGLNNIVSLTGATVQRR